MKVLETERLVLRWFAASDAGFILELLNEPGWKRFIGDRHIDTLDAAGAYLSSGPLASYTENGFGLYAVQQKANNELVGMCGLIKRQGLDDVDIGFALLARYEGQGFAVEAAAATLAFARATLALTRIVAITTVDNDRSARVLEHIGMQYERDVVMPGEDQPLRLFSVNFDLAQD